MVLAPRNLAGVPNARNGPSWIRYVRNFPHARCARPTYSRLSEDFWSRVLWTYCTDHTLNTTLRPAARDVFGRRFALLRPNVSKQCCPPRCCELISGAAEPGRLHLTLPPRLVCRWRCVFVNDARAAPRGNIGCLVDVRYMCEMWGIAR